VRQALLHHHGADVRLGGRVGRLPHHLDVDRVEALLGQRELAVLLELDRVVRAELDVRVLQDILAAQPQLAGHRVEVDVLDHDLQRQPHALAVRAAGGGLVLDLAHGGGLDAVARVAGDEVEDVPHVLVLVRQQRDRAPAVLLEAALEDLHMRERERRRDVSQRRGRATVFWRASCRARAVMREDAKPSGREDQLRRLGS
jgi:hypothetical protein